MSEKGDMTGFRDTLEAVFGADNFCVYRPGYYGDMTPVPEDSDLLKAIVMLGTTSMVKGFPFIEVLLTRTIATVATARNIIASAHRWARKRNTRLIPGGIVL